MTAMRHVKRKLQYELFGDKSVSGDLGRNRKIFHSPRQRSLSPIRPILGYMLGYTKLFQRRTGNRRFTPQTNRAAEVHYPTYDRLCCPARCLYGTTSD